MIVPAVPDGSVQNVSEGQDKADTAGKLDTLGASTCGEVTTLTASTTMKRRAIDKVVMKDGECGPDGQNTMAKVTTDERSTTGDNRGILVRGGRKGKGQPLFNVRDIAAQFRTMASNASNHTSDNLILNKTPKRKTDEDWVDSPSKKCKSKSKLKFEEE